MTPLISIVITTYNYADYLASCIESVLNQTYKNYEIILINDGSTDNTHEVVAPYLENDNIKYIEQRNAGQAAAKNNGVRESSGEFIAFLDADDGWMADKLEKQIALFSSDQELGVAYTRAEWVDKNGNPIKANDVEPHNGWVTNHLVVDNFVHFSSVLLRINCLERVGGFDERLDMGIDWDLWLKVSKHYKFVCIDERLISYRVGHPGQMSDQQQKRQQQSDYVLERFIKQNPGLVPESALKKAKAYTYRNRGDYYSSIDKKKSLRFNIRSLRLNPFQPRIYARILKALLTTSSGVSRRT